MTEILKSKFPLTITKNKIWHTKQHEKTNTEFCHIEIWTYKKSSARATKHGHIHGISYGYGQSITVTAKRHEH